jgi:hypothetical protein
MEHCSRSVSATLYQLRVRKEIPDSEIRVSEFFLRLRQPLISRGEWATASGMFLYMREREHKSHLDHKIRRCDDKLLTTCSHRYFVTTPRIYT